MKPEQESMRAGPEAARASGRAEGGDPGDIPGEAGNVLCVGEKRPARGRQLSR